MARMQTRGYFSFISEQSAVPFLSGKEISSNITFTSWFSKKLSVAFPVVKAPTISSISFFSKSDRRPSITTGWSSTKITDICCISFINIYFYINNSAFSRTAVHLHFPVKHVYPLLNIQKANAFFIFQGLYVKSLTIIFNRDKDTVFILTALY